MKVMAKFFGDLIFFLLPIYNYYGVMEHMYMYADIEHEQN